MRRQRGLVGLMGLAALVGLGLARPAAAAVTTEQSASILVFPKVISDGTRDTIIQITNTSNNMRHAHCFYVNGALTNPSLPVGPLNPPLWTEIDFDIWLTKQQPTHWVVSTGRLDNPTERNCRGGTMCATGPVCVGGASDGKPCPNGASDCAGGTCVPKQSGTDQADCCDAGFDPGRVPPVVPGFTGELKCIEVDQGGFPVPGNALKGEATLEDIGSGDVSKYNAVGLKGFDTNNMDNILCLGGGVTEQCPNGAEYEGCPATWILDHPATFAPDRVVEQQSFCTTHPCSEVTTNITVVPCTENFETQTPPPITLQFKVYNEYEQFFSASTTFTCWGSFDLGSDDPLANGINSIFKTVNVGGEILQGFVRSSSGTPGGVMIVIEETHKDNAVGHGFTAKNAQNGVTSFQDQAAQDIITIPADQIQQQ